MSLVAAVARPFGLSESVVAVPGAAIVVLTGIVGGHDALVRLKEIGPTVAFLAGILVFGHLCAEAKVFDYLGSRAAVASAGSARRLLAIVVGLAAAVTAVLTLDPLAVLYDGRARAEDNWHEVTGVARSEDGLTLTSDGEAALASQHSDGALRYVAVVPLPEGGSRWYAEVARPDGAHDLVTVLAP